MPVDTQFSFAAGEVSPSIYGRADLRKFDSAAKTLLNFIVHREGGASNRAGLEFTGAVHDSARKTRLIPFKFNTLQTYILEFSHLTMRVIKDGACVMDPAVSITDITQADPAEVTIGAHSYVAGQEVFISDVGGMTELNGRFFRIKAATATTVTLEDIFGNNIDSTNFSAYTSGGKAEVVPVFTTVYDENDLELLKYTQKADTLTITHPDYADMYDITRTDHHVWNITAVSFTPGIAAPVNFTATPSTANTGLIRNYVVTAVDADTGEESIASNSDNADHDISTGVGRTNDLAWDAVANASTYNLYCDDNASGIFGFIGRAGTNAFEDNYIDPDYTRTPPETATPFSGAGNTPRAVTYHQQRRIYAGTNNKPSTWFASRIGIFTNMNKSAVTQDDDAITFNIVADDVHEIRDMKSAKDLFVFTSSGIWRVETGERLAFSADNITAKEQQAWGVSNVNVIKIGESMLYVQDGERAVRDLQDTIETNGFSGDDLTILAKHLFKTAKIKHWAYARDPDSIIWCVMDDGTAVAITYLRKHQLFAWHRHTTDGEFESVAAVPETTEEYGVYFVIKRTVNGQTMRYVERMKSRNITDIKDSFFVDSGLTLDNPVTITGAAQADPVVVTADAHGLSSGDLVDIVEVKGMTELNDNRYKAANVTANTIELTDPKDDSNIDGTAFNAYESGGRLRKAVTVISNLYHLEGKTVSVLADGGTEPQKTVADGRISIDDPASRIHAGLGYQSDLETIGVDLTALNNYGDSMARRKSIPIVKIRVKDSVGLWIGPDKDNIEEYKPPAAEAGKAQDFINGVIEKNIAPAWEHDGTLFIRQKDPLPLSVLNVMPEVTVVDNP